MSFSNAFGKSSVNSIGDDIDEIIRKNIVKSKKWLNKYNKIINYIPDVYQIENSKSLGEIGWEVNGFPVSHDFYATSERIYLMYKAGIFEKIEEKNKQGEEVNVLEIGAGYGGVARYIKQIFPFVNYCICDLPESMLFSAVYLYVNKVFDEVIIFDKAQPQKSKNFCFVPNYYFDDFSKTMKLDLAINTLSFPELSIEQVDNYSRGMVSMLGGKGILFEQNLDCRYSGMIDHREILEKHFRNKKQIFPSFTEKCTQGDAFVWSTGEIEFFCDANVVTKFINSGLDKKILLLICKLFGPNTINKIKKIKHRLVN